VKTQTPKRNARQAAWKERNPWARHVEYARRRCTDRKHRDFASYGAKGIKVFLTAAQAGVLWKRDKAGELKKPSLDRKESDKHYCVHNCRFIEHWLNTQLPHNAALRALDSADCGDPSWQDQAVPAWVTD
jgi:hypothetical protein